MKRVSVVIPNFNYGSFVADAVESALGLDWSDVEVIVVDDGSTDDSIAILRGFGNRITLLRQRNSGPRVSCNRGFAASTGDAVIFLDSDDVLEPDLARAVALVWTPAISKVQVQMSRIDGAGKRSGSAFPVYRGSHSTGEIRRWLVGTSAYPTPPGSGNVYARTFLDKLFPLDDRCGDSTDSACLAAAPLMGEVVTISRPLVRYRVHGGNRSRLAMSPERFSHQLARAEQRQRFCHQLIDAEESRAVGGVEGSLRRGRHLLQMRVAHFRIGSSGAAYSWDGFGRMLRDAMRAPFAPGPEPAVIRGAIALWCLATLLAPRALAHRLVGLRFAG